MRETLPLLSVDSMAVDFTAPARYRVLDDISFAMNNGTSLVILGESGSGKTVLSRALTGLFPPHQHPRVGGTVVFDGTAVDVHRKDKLRRLRQKGIRYVFQDPMQALNPVAKIRTQLRRAAADRVPGADDLAGAMQDVGLEPDVLNMFPHQLSVGMAQRVAIAMAIIALPRLLIADEPTSALDVTLRIQIMELLSSLCKAHNVGMLLITHDLGIARRYGDVVVLLYRGRIVESAPVQEFFRRPLHPYARLLNDLQRSQYTGVDAYEASDPGPPATGGCRFSNECPLVKERCRHEEPALEQVADGRKVRCFFWK